MNEFDKLSPAELRAGVDEYFKPKGAAYEPPLPPGVDRSKLSVDAATNVSDLWLASLMKKEASALTPAEQIAVKHAVDRVMREELGH